VGENLFRAYCLKSNDYSISSLDQNKIVGYYEGFEQLTNRNSMYAILKK
jgi:hypothetical protein